jgi:tripartite-type tricarboxylate transporter receptor subunit TctC
MRVRLALVTAAILLARAGASAESLAYPERSVTMVVAFAPGGSSDVLARAVAEALSRRLGKPVTVDNRPGAGGHVGAEAVARAKADGYTVLFGTNGTLAIGPALHRSLRYDPEHDLAPVGLLHKLPLVLMVNPAVPATTAAELIGYARSNPGKLSFASAGVGSVSHLAGELFREKAKVDILHVPYKGGGAAVADLLTGRVSMMLETIPNVLPLVRAGQMRAIGVTTREPSPSAPDIPTLAGSGLPDFDVSAWTGLFAPAGTPRPIIDRLNAETAAIAGDRDYAALIRSMGTDVAASTPQAFAAFVHDDIARWTAVMARSGIQKID